MKALTVRQPYAECIARGAKLVENRSQRVAYRGPLAIHAALQSHDTGFDDERVQWELQRRTGYGAWDHGGVELPTDARGVVIAVAELVDCHAAAQDRECCGPWGDQRYGDKPAVHLVLDNVRRLQVQFAMTGRLGLWDIDDEQIRAAMPLPQDGAS